MELCSIEDETIFKKQIKCTFLKKSLSSKVELCFGKAGT
jgi:hypothetical protein